MPAKLNTQEFIKKAKFIHKNKYEYNQVNYINSHTPVKIYCKKCKEYFYQIPNNHLTGMGCKKCSIKNTHTKQKYTKVDFINKAILIHKDLYKYSSIDFKDMHTPVKIYCKRCKSYFYQTPTSHLSGRGCKRCNDKNKVLSWDIQFIKLKKLGITKYLDFSFAKYINTKHKIEVCCKKCGKHFYALLGNIIGGKSCPHCKFSKGEKQVLEFLTKNSIKFIQQYQFLDCKYKKPLYFDFYLPDYNTCIEYQGGQHYEKFRFETTDTELKLRQYRDQIKRNYCNTHHIKLVEIRYNESAEEVLTKSLVEKK